METELKRRLLEEGYFKNPKTLVEVLARAGSTLPSAGEEAMIVHPSGEAEGPDAPEGADRMSDQPIVYIGGYGRSGSTVLDLLLGSHPTAVSVGELSSLPEDWCLSHRTCSCGRRYADCQFWGGLWDSDAEAQGAVRILQSVESRAVLHSLDAEKIEKRLARDYSLLNQRVLQHARRRSGRRVIVDSSKSSRNSAGRALALARLADQDVFFIHMVRHPYSVIESFHRRGSNWAAEGHGTTKALVEYRTAVGWTLANDIASRVQQQLGPTRYLVVRHEDLRFDPEHEVKRIADFLRWDPDPLLSVLADEQGLTVGHNVGGNRVRLQRQVRIDRSVRATADAFQIRPWHRWFFELTPGRRLRRRFGYPSGPKPRPTSARS